VNTRKLVQTGGGNRRGATRAKNQPHKKEDVRAIPSGRNGAAPNKERGCQGTRIQNKRGVGKKKSSQCMIFKRSNNKKNLDRMKKKKRNQFTNNPPNPPPTKHGRKDRENASEEGEIERERETHKKKNSSKKGKLNLAPPWLKGHALVEKPKKKKPPRGSQRGRRRGSRPVVVIGAMVEPERMWRVASRKL